MDVHNMSVSDDKASAKDLRTKCGTTTPPVKLVGDAQSEEVTFKPLLDQRVRHRATMRSGNLHTKGAADRANAATEEQ